MLQTDHAIPGRVRSGNAERRIFVVVEAVDGPLPVVDAAGQSETTQNDSVVETTAGHRQAVVRE